MKSRFSYWFNSLFIFIYLCVNRAYDPSDFDHLPVTAEIKELFQYITR